MPLKSSSPPPEVMTWKKTSFVLTGAVIFDLVRAFFNMFWFFGPALAAWYCTNVASGWVGSLWGLTTAACAGLAVEAGALAAAITIPFGAIMANATTLFGFLLLGMIVLWTNMRILKSVQSVVLKFGGSAAISAIPLVGIVPLFTFTLWRLYRNQIQVETAAYKNWEEETVAARKQQRNRALNMQPAQSAQFPQRQITPQEASY